MTIRLYFALALLMACLPGPVSHGQDQNDRLLTRIRDSISMAFENESTCRALFNEYSAIPNPNGLLKGYIGGLHIARSRHASLLGEKNSYLKKGVAMLEEAIKNSPENIELLFLRLTIQLNLPAVTGYKKSIESDKKFVLTNYQKAIPEVKKNIRYFILNSGFFTKEEQALAAQ